MFQARVPPSRIDNNNNTDREEKRKNKDRETDKVSRRGLRDRDSHSCMCHGVLSLALATESSCSVW